MFTIFTHLTSNAESKPLNQPLRAKAVNLTSARSVAEKISLEVSGVKKEICVKMMNRTPHFRHDDSSQIPETGYSGFSSVVIPWWQRNDTNKK